MAKPRVLVTREIPAAGLDLIAAACEATIWSGPLPPEPNWLREELPGCQGLVSLLTETISAELMDLAPELKVISNFAVGYNNIDIPAATERGIPVGNTPGVLTEATADCAFALLIAAARGVVAGHQYVQAGQWKTWEPKGHIGQDLQGRTLGIVGMGRIGTALARRCHFGWGMPVIYFNRSRNAAAERELGARRVELEELLTTSDFISVHAALNEASRGMFNRAAFAKMKPTAVFVNTARGPLVVEADLAEALKSQTIFAAGLDVTDPEPPRMDNPLLGLPNLVILPHVGSATVSSRDGMARIAAENLLAGLRGEQLPHCVNPEVQR